MALAGKPACRGWRGSRRGWSDRKDQRPLHSGSAARGDVLAAIPVRHALTGRIRANPNLTGRAARKVRALDGEAVYAVPMNGGAVWCRWISTPRKAVLPLVDVPRRGACYVVADKGIGRGLAQEVSVSPPEGLFVSELSWVPDMLLVVPGFAVELADVTIGGPMRLALVLDRIDRSSVTVVGKVLWDGGEAVLETKVLPLLPGQDARLDAFGGVLGLARTATPSDRVEVRLIAPVPDRPAGPLTLPGQLKVAAASPELQAANIYPARAEEEQVEGTATLQCHVNERGLLSQCAVVKEDPPGYGFGEAALAMTGGIRMEPPRDAQGRIKAASLTLPIRFALPKTLPSAGDNSSR